MVKPVRLAEFKARVGALLRRAYPNDAQDVLEFGRFRFLPRRGLEMDGKPVELKAREYELALFLFQNMGRLLSRDHLREVIWGHSAEVISRSLDTHVSRLRSLLDLRPANGYMITAVWRGLPLRGRQADGRTNGQRQRQPGPIGTANKPCGLALDGAGTPGSRGEADASHTHATATHARHHLWPWPSAPHWRMAARWPSHWT
jgi:DNA-binding winged helix-turn-helix (wHTH) protein